MAYRHIVQQQSYPGIVGGWGDWWYLRNLLPLWVSRIRERRQLLALDDRLLADIGVDRNGALKEAERPFWEGALRR